MRNMKRNGKYRRIEIAKELRMEVKLPITSEKRFVRVITLCCR